MQNQHPTVLLRVLDLVQSLALYGLPVSTALFALSGATEGYRVPKDAVAQGAIAIFVAAWTLKHLWAEDLIDAFRALREVPVLLPLTCFVVWMFVTTLVSRHARFSFRVDLNVVLFLALYALSFHEWNPARVRRWIALVALAATLNGILMVLQRAKVPLGGYLSYYIHPYPRLRMIGLIGNVNDVGNYLILVLLLTCAAALLSRERLLRVIYSIGLPFLSVLLAWTEAYTSIVALGVALLLSFAMLGRTHRKLAFRAGSLVLITLLLGAAAAWHVLKNPSVQQRWRETVSAARAGHWNQALHGRYFAWRMTADMIGDRPLWGHGPGTFSYIFFDYQLRFKAAHPGVITQPEYFDQAHNDCLQIAAEMGVPALLLVAWVVGSFLWKAGDALKRAERRTPALGRTASFGSTGTQTSGLLSDETALPLLGIALLAAMIVTSLAGFPFRLAVTMSLFVPVASMSLSLAREKVCGKRNCPEALNGSQIAGAAAPTKHHSHSHF